MYGHWTCVIACRRAATVSGMSIANKNRIKTVAPGGFDRSQTRGSSGSGCSARDDDGWIGIPDFQHARRSGGLLCSDLGVPSTRKLSSELARKADLSRGISHALDEAINNWHGNLEWPVTNRMRPEVALDGWQNEADDLVLRSDR